MPLKHSFGIQASPPQPVPCVVSAGDSLLINYFQFFLISKEYQLTFTDSSVLPKLHITPKCSFSLPEGLFWPEWFYESGWYFSLREKLHIDWILEKNTWTLSCKFILCYVFWIHSYCNLQMARQCCYLLKSIVPSKFWWKNDVSGVMNIQNNSHIFPRAWAERGGV